MITYSDVDKSFFSIVNPIWNNLNKIIDAYYLFFTQGWFIQGLKDQELVEYLDYVVEGKENQSLFNLIKAFEYQGTCSSLSFLAKAIFGIQSQSIIDDEIPGAIEIQIQNANTLFSSAQLTSDATYVQLEDGQEFVQISTDVTNVIGYDVFNLFRRMVMNGRRLLSVTINQ